MMFLILFYIIYFIILIIHFIFVEFIINYFSLIDKIRSGYIHFFYPLGYFFLIFLWLVLIIFIYVIYFHLFLLDLFIIYHIRFFRILISDALFYFHYITLNINRIIIKNLICYNSIFLLFHFNFIKNSYSF